MRIRTIAVAAVMSLTGLTAFAQDVKVDFDKSADFSAIKTFSVKIGTSWNNQISEKRIVTEVEETLVEKGWQKVDANPDAVVVLHGATQTKRSLNTFYSGGGYGGYGYRGWGGGMGMGTATTTESEYAVATLVVDIFNAKTKARCSAASRATRSRTRRRRTSRRWTPTPTRSSCCTARPRPSVR